VKQLSNLQSAYNSFNILNQDEIIPFFDAIMTPLKQFLVYDENPDSFVMFNQTLDTLAYLARAAGPSGNFFFLFIAYFIM